jgi:glyoxylase-like metal-dependent hydrolase (beta-lactamase superfamily II)
MPIRVYSIRTGFSFCYVVDGGNGTVLVDCGSPGHEDRIVRRLGDLGCGELRLVFITHAHLDHYGSASALRRLTGAPVGVHTADADAMAGGETPLGDVRGWGRVMKRLMPLVERFMGPEPTHADVLFEHGARLESFGIDAEVVHTPGHTPGSSTLIVEGRIAFVGDLVSTRGRPHAQLFYATDWSAVARSLRHLQELDLEEVYTGHGPRPMSGKVFKKLKAPDAAEL